MYKQEKDLQTKIAKEYKLDEAIKGAKLKEFDKNDFLTYQLDYKYNKQAKCPLWDKFLDEMLPNKEHQMLLHQYQDLIATMRNQTIHISLNDQLKFHFHHFHVTFQEMI